MEDDKPNPGSDEAIERGCSCPQLDNHRGKGFPVGGGHSFWISEQCDVHGIDFASLHKYTGHGEEEE